MLFFNDLDKYMSNKLHDCKRYDRFCISEHVCSLHFNKLSETCCKEDLHPRQDSYECGHHRSRRSWKNDINSSYHERLPLAIPLFLYISATQLILPQL